MLHGTCVGEEAGARNLVYFPCKVAAAGDEGQLVCAAGACTLVLMFFGSSMVFCTVCFFVRSSMPLWNPWLQIAQCNGCMIVAMFCSMCVDTCGFATWCYKTHCIVAASMFLAAAAVSIIHTIAFCSWGSWIVLEWFLSFWRWWFFFQNFL